MALWKATWQGTLQPHTEAGVLSPGWLGAVLGLTGATLHGWEVEAEWSEAEGAQGTVAPWTPTGNSAKATSVSLDPPQPPGLFLQPCP